MLCATQREEEEKMRTVSIEHVHIIPSHTQLFHENPNIHHRLLHIDHTHSHSQNVHFFGKERRVLRVGYVSSVRVNRREST